MDEFQSLRKRKNYNVDFPMKKMVDLSYSKGLKEELRVPIADLLGCEDLTRLPYLYNETVLECITARYDENLIYTWAGPVLIAVNPFRVIRSLYSKSLIQEILKNSKEGKDNQRPHVFTIAGLSHRRLVSQIGSVDQAVLVSGESGAGKTESARYLLNYLTHAEPETSCSEAQEVQRRIIASNPILEAFGNASTIRNHNSSRFGKLIRLQYQANSLKGALTDTYLLEKTRVTHQPVQERNFHIFHQVLSGIKNGLLQTLESELGSFGSFHIIPEVKKSEEANDLETFRETLDALNQMGIGSEHQLKLFKIVVAIMHLGNITFDFDAKKEAYVISRDDVCIESLEKASTLLGLPQDELVEVLTIKCISVVTGEKKTVYHKLCERREQCEGRRDSFMQLLYVSLFTHLVTTINERTASKSDLLCSYLGILDVYGFETFDENSLEQLCINYTNERLQQEFTRRYLASEQRILIEEGFIDVHQLLTDNSNCVTALDSPISVFSILNEECQLKRALNERSACERVCNALQNTGIISAPPSPVKSSGFVVKHYAGHVNYSSSGILHKNKDEVPGEIFDLLSHSSNSFIAQLAIVKEESEKRCLGGTPGRRLKKVTTLAKFKSSLDSLMKILISCDLHYVRCVKPNLKGISGHPDKLFLINQLQANGILETVKISQAGYPVRLLYAEFTKRYVFSLRSYSIYTDKEKTFVLTLKLLGDDGTGSPPVEKCRFGRNRIFLSESSLQKLDELRELHRNSSAACIQKNYRTFSCRRKYLILLKKLRIVQRQIRVWLIRRQFLIIRSSVMVIQKNIRMGSQRRRYEKLRSATLVIQKFTRGWLCRRAFKKLVQQMDPYICSSSRLSMCSTGYGSLAHSSLTDNSISDAETFVISDDIKRLYSNLDLQRRICETEESGLETDTESLSGEGLKTGRTPKSKKGRVFNANLIDLSDTDFSDEHAQNSHLSKVYLHPHLRSRQKHAELSSEQTLSSRFFKGRNCNFSSNLNSFSSSQRPLPFHTSPPKRERVRRNPTNKVSQSLISSVDMDRLRVATLKQLHEVTGIIKGSEPSEILRIHLPTNNLYLHFKNGILSYRQMPKGPIKFHTRRTCLPYSTSIPHVEKPKGLFDAIR